MAHRVARNQTGKIDHKRFNPQRFRMVSQYPSILSRDFRLSMNHIEMKTNLDSDDDKTTILPPTSTTLLTTIGWKPGQMKNCTEPGTFVVKNNR